jgi:hypothetical protein
LAVQGRAAACTSAEFEDRGYVAGSDAAHLRIYQREARFWKVKDLTRCERLQNVSHSSVYIFQV